MNSSRRGIVNGFKLESLTKVSRIMFSSCLLFELVLCTSLSLLHLVYYTPKLRGCVSIKDAKLMLNTTSLLKKTFTK